MKITTLYIIFLFLAFGINAQEHQDEEELIQLTGRLFDEYLQPLPYAHIQITNKDKGSITDHSGKFSFIVSPFDTVIFSSMGYKRKQVVVPDTLAKPFYIRDVLIESDTFKISEVRIYPWRDYEEFKEAFINLELPEDDMDRARKNIALIKTQIEVDRNPSIAGNFNHVMERHYQDMMFRGQQPTYQLFNVFAWQKFIQALQNGDNKQKK